MQGLSMNAPNPAPRVFAPAVAAFAAFFAPCIFAQTGAPAITAGPSVGWTPSR